jgi:hypothetical protein
MNADIRTLGDGLAVVAGLIRAEHADCADCGDWFAVAAWLDQVAVVPLAELCEPRRERALSVVRTVLAARAGVPA